MIVRGYGTDAVLVELADADEVLALRLALDGTPLAGMTETMPGLRTVLVRFDDAVTSTEGVAKALLQLDLHPLQPAHDGPGREVTVRVDYDGADLDEIAERTGLSTSEVVAAHQVPRYRIVLIGMAPGFYFLAGGDPRLRVPRRRTPRTNVPKGALGLAGDFTGVYPRTGPGGWQLLGTVLDELWHPTDIPAATLSPGTTVRFVAA